MKNGHKNIVFIILGLFILSFSFPSNTLKLLIQSEDSISIDFSAEETKDSKKLFEDKEIHCKNSFIIRKLAFSDHVRNADFLKSGQDYSEIISPPPENLN